ncbi:MAG: phosphate ABC transporter permease PstA [Acidobacteriota bacterium]|jgi:phosphate transport system permease protein
MKDRALIGGRVRGSDVLGRSLTYLCGGALALNLLLVLGIMGLLAYHGLAYFWQKPLVLFETADGARHLGEVWETEPIPDAAPAERFRVKVGNRDVDGVDFLWIQGPEVVDRSRPRTAVLLERLEWGNFYGFVRQVQRGDTVLASGPEETWRALRPLLAEKEEERAAIEDLEGDEIEDVNYRLEDLRLEKKEIALEDHPPEREERLLAEIDAEMAELDARYQVLAEELFARREALMAEQLVLETASGETRLVPVGEIVRALRPNAMGTLRTAGLYLSRMGELVADDPRESNTEGGIFPAIFGTVMMVFLMSFAVAPLGVLAALYLREYARQGPLVRAVRIAVNNLAGVPSIVFGVFGLGFFVYLVGGSIDRIFFPEALPTPTYGTGGILWGALTLALLTVPVVIVAAEEGLAAVPRIVREGSLALGATKFETIWRVVIPAAAPGILTGMILAMARAAGEVAPLMIVGMVKLAPALPIDGHFPFIHPERKFMHLGFHIYDVGFQSPNVEATKPLVFATALLLILIVTLMNVVAIALRNHLRRKYAGASV